MKMTLGTFLSFALHAGGNHPTALISAALAHYGDSLARAEPPLAVPVFLEDPPPVEEVEVDVDPVLEHQLRAEAERQGVEIERLLSHAVLVYLAERDRAGAAGEAS
jgi:hypothetical protein